MTKTCQENLKSFTYEFRANTKPCCALLIEWCESNVPHQLMKTFAAGEKKTLENVCWSRQQLKSCIHSFQHCAGCVNLFVFSVQMKQKAIFKLLNRMPAIWRICFAQFNSPSGMFCLLLLHSYTHKNIPKIKFHHWIMVLHKGNEMKLNLIYIICRW